MKISALYVEPKKEPRMIEIDNELEAMQGAVGGYIEEYMPFEDDVAIVLNEEGKLLNLPFKIQKNQEGNERKEKKNHESIQTD